MISIFFTGKKKISKLKPEHLFDILVNRNRNRKNLSVRVFDYRVYRICIAA